MGRAAHNWRNKQKLLEKHGASGRKGRDKGKWGDKWSDDKWNDGWKGASAKGSWKSTDSWWEDRKVLKKRAVGAEKKNTGKVKKTLLKKKVSLSSDSSGKIKNTGKVKKTLLKKTVSLSSDSSGKIKNTGKVKKTLLKKKVSLSSDSSGKVKKAKLKKEVVSNNASNTDDTLKPKGVRKLKKLKKGKQAPTSEAESPEGVKKVRKLKKGTKKSTSEPGSATKRKKIVKAKKETVDDKLSRKPKVVKEKRIKLRKKWVRHYARVVCPGSLTERFVKLGHAASHSSLTSFERGMLASGPLSWRWLRDEDDDLMPPKSRPVQVDTKAHWKALSASGESIAKRAGEKLWALDGALGTDCFWPACAERVALADRLRSKGGLRRRCERYFAEVLHPLLENNAKQADSAAEVMSQARQLVTRCAMDWLAVSGNLVDAGARDSPNVRHAWLQLLRRSLDSLEAGSEVAPKSWHAWLSSLRQAQLARLCPDLDADARTKLLRSVTLAAPAMSEATSDDVNKTTNSSLVVLPLGVFTFWQSLALVALTRREGRHAMLVRRKADGAAEVLFRTSEVVLRTS